MKVPNSTLGDLDVNAVLQCATIGTELGKENISGAQGYQNA